MSFVTKYFHPKVLFVDAVLLALVVLVYLEIM